MVDDEPNALTPAEVEAFLRGEPIRRHAASDKEEGEDEKALSSTEADALLEGESLAGQAASSAHKKVMVLGVQIPIPKRQRSISVNF